jgi:hypothetical protein
MRTTPTATRPRMPRVTLRLPRRAVVDLQTLAAAAERPPAVVARYLLLEAIAKASSAAEVA